MMNNQTCYEIRNTKKQVGYVYSERVLLDALLYWLDKMTVRQAINDWTVRVMGTNKVTNFWDFYLNWAVLPQVGRK